MQLVVRADDVGYTDVCNIGAFEAIENGIVTSADIMLDCPGTVDALYRLQKLPWISVGWHAHFWGTPVLNPKDVPTLYDASRKGFRKDLRLLEDVDYEEALAECRAEMDRCVEILGRAPDVSGFGMGDTPMSRAMATVEKEYGMKTGFMFMPGFTGSAEDWDGKKIIAMGFEAFADLQTDSLTEIEKYDPIRYYLQDLGGLLKLPDHAVALNCWHPGYIDYFVYRLGDYGPNARNFITARPVDVHALCSDEVKDWIKRNKIQLINLRDALYETHEYQNHLRSMGSDLYMQN